MVVHANQWAHTARLQGFSTQCPEPKCLSNARAHANSSNAMKNFDLSVSHEEGNSSSDIVRQSSGEVDAQSFYRDFSKILNKISSDPELLQCFLLSLDLIYVGSGRSGNVFKANVFWGKDQEIEVVLKIADILKYPHLEEELAFEAQVCGKLDSLEGTCLLTARFGIIA